LQNRIDIAPASLERTVELMNIMLPDANVTGYESLIAGLELPDEDDSNVRLRFVPKLKSLSR
jgi:hypothetical protein